MHAALFTSALRHLTRATAATATAAALAATTAHAQVGEVPTGWGPLPGTSHDYVMGTDLARRDGGQGLPGATIRSVADTPQGWASMGQSIRADAYRGKRVRLSGRLRLDDAGTSCRAMLWMRADGGGGVQVADFTKDRPVFGATGWTPEEVVLDVPADAVGITYGFLLDGTGQVWLDGVRLEVVGPEVAVTRPAGGVALEGDAVTTRARAEAYRHAPPAPVNLGLQGGGSSR